MKTTAGNERFCASGGVGSSDNKCGISPLVPCGKFSETPACGKAAGTLSASGRKCSWQTKT